MDSYEVISYTSHLFIVSFAATSILVGMFLPDGFHWLCALLLPVLAGFYYVLLQKRTSIGFPRFMDPSTTGSSITTGSTTTSSLYSIYFDVPVASVKRYGSVSKEYIRWVSLFGVMCSFAILFEEGNLSWYKIVTLFTILEIVATEYLKMEAEAQHYCAGKVLAMVTARLRREMVLEQNGERLHNYVRRRQQVRAMLLHQLDLPSRLATRSLHRRHGVISEASFVVSSASPQIALAA